MWLINLFRAISQNGGFIKSCLVYTRTDSVKFGKFIGRDKLNNRYYENSYYFLSRNRWVLFSNRAGYDYDATQIHYEWFRWMHYMTDIPPCDEKRPEYRWMLPHTENMTGTSGQYVPYSTTKPKIIPWKPKKPRRRA